MPTLLLFLAALAAMISPAAAARHRVPQDHGSIQAAVDAAAEGDTVVVAAGTYKERLVLKPGVTVRSDGTDEQGVLGLKRAEATTIDGAFPGASGPGVTMAENSTLDGFSVTGVGVYDDASWQKHHRTLGEEQPHEHIGAEGTAGIAVMGIARCTVTNNIVHHIGYTGIAVTGGPDKRVAPLLLRNVAYRNMGGGIGSMKGSVAIIQENTCFENFYAGIGHNDASPVVLDNVCHGNIRAGIGISEHSCPIVRGNKCYQNRRAGIGIRTGAATQPIVEHNECYENEMAGIGCRDEARPVIRHNHCYKNKMAGIGSRDGSRAVIEFNDCHHNGMSGIGSRRGAAPVIRDNRCYRNMMAGIGSREGARPVIEGNECFENKMAGIGSQQDATPVIRDNRCHKNEMAGVGSRLGARPVIVGNECSANQMAGIGSREGAAPVIRGNHSHDNTMAGIGSRLGARPLIADNLARNNQKAGIGVRDAATVALIVGNRCLDNRLVAVGVPDGASALIHGNQLSRKGGGAPPIVALRGGARAVVSQNVIREGGVAGVLLQGTALLAGNQFEGRGPDGQGSAVWVPFGGAFDYKSTLIAANNRCTGYRNLLNASNARVLAAENVTRDFSGASIIVKRPSGPSIVRGNVAISDDTKDTAVEIEGEVTGAENVVRASGAEEKPAGPGLAPWPLLDARRLGDSFHPWRNTGREVVVEDGPWKLVVTCGETLRYALYNTEDDPQSENDLSARLEQIVFRMRGLVEQQEGREYREGME